MSQYDRTEELLTKIEDYLSTSNSDVILPNISKFMNQNYFDASKIRGRFQYTVQMYTNEKLRKILDLIEYLTVHSKAKIVSIIGDTNFAESLQQFFFDPQYETTVLNLMKLWHDTLQDHSASLRPIFEIIENLPNFGLSIPDEYESKFAKGIQNAGIAIIDQDSSSDDENSAENATSIEVNSKLEQCKKFRENCNRIYEDKNFDSVDKNYQKSTLNILITQGKELIQFFKDFQEFFSNFPEYYKNLNQELHNHLDRLNQKMSKLLGNESQQQENICDTFLNLGGNNNEDQSSNDTNYKQQANYTQKPDISDLLKWKVDSCCDGISCKNAPQYSCIIGKDQLAKSDAKCKFYHTSTDKRREIFVCSQKFTYYATLCNNPSMCPFGDTCGECHNDIEYMYHPHVFKTKFCPFGQCEGLLCPYYHSKQEKQLWRSELIGFFGEDIMSDQEQSGDEDSNKGNEHISGWVHNSDHQTHQETGGQKDEVELQDLAMTINIRLVDQVQSSSHSGQHYLHEEGSGNMMTGGQSSGFGGYQNRTLMNSHSNNQQQLFEEESKFNIHGKLIINKKQRDPSEVSAFFQQNPIYWGFPLINQYLPSKEQLKQMEQQQQQEIQQVSNSDEKYIDNVD